MSRVYPIVDLAERHSDDLDVVHHPFAYVPKAA